MTDCCCDDMASQWATGTGATFGQSVATRTVAITNRRKGSQSKAEDGYWEAGSQEG